jgi:alcohol dehydrogenase class IV
MSLFATARTPRNIVFGWGQRASLANYARALGSRALICTDERMAADPAMAGMVDSLKAAGLAVEIFDRTAQEVPLSAIALCMEQAKKFGPDLVIGVGGGSCLDMAKVTAALLSHGGSARDYYGEFKIPGPVLPLIAVPTTAGTGSEATPVAVLADDELTLKVGIASPHLIPHTAICDPELTLTCPRGLTAVAGADALTHAIEAVTAGVRAVTPGVTHEHVFLGKNGLSDLFGLEAIGHLARGLRRAVEHPDDRDAREAVMYGALLAGLAFGTAGTSAAHAIQYPVGALTHTAHGSGVACVLPYAMEFNRSAALSSMASVAVAMKAARAEDDEAAKADAAIQAVATLFEAIGIPPTLKALGLAEDRLDWTAEQSMKAGRLVKNNPRPLDVPAMRAILGAAYTGDRAALRTTL